MKFIRLASIFIAILAILIISIPVSATPTTTTTTYIYKVNGIEISAGSPGHDGSLPATIGATFSGLATSPSNTGLLFTSVNYDGLGPNATSGNEIFGGTWSITSLKGTISGIIVKKNPTGETSNIKWGPTPNAPTNSTAMGTAVIYLSITRGTGHFAHINKGNGVFNGYDIHESGVYVTINGQRIEVPVLKGQLSLTY
jgi:hypothetical protein